MIIAPPLFSPKYPEYQDINKAYEWGEIETSTQSHIIDRNTGTGYINTGIALFSNVQENENCDLTILNFEAKPTSGDFSDSGFWTGTPNDYWGKTLKKVQPVIVLATSSRTSKISDLDISIKVKTGEYCSSANSVIDIQEKLILKMRRHTLWGFLFDLVMSV